MNHCFADVIFYGQDEKVKALLDFLEREDTIARDNEKMPNLWDMKEHLGLDHDDMRCVMENVERRSKRSISCFFDLSYTSHIETFDEIAKKFDVNFCMYADYENESPDVYNDPDAQFFGQKYILTGENLETYFYQMRDEPSDVYYSENELRSALISLYNIAGVTTDMNFITEDVENLANFIGELKTIDRVNSETYDEANYKTYCMTEFYSVMDIADETDGKDYFWNEVETVSGRPNDNEYDLIFGIDLASGEALLDEYDNGYIESLKLDEEPFVQIDFLYDTRNEKSALALRITNEDFSVDRYVILDTVPDFIVENIHAQVREISMDRIDLKEYLSNDPSLFNVSPNTFRPPITMPDKIEDEIER